MIQLDDDTRVCLKQGTNDYINASYVQVPAANRNYILTQVNFHIYFEDYSSFCHRDHYKQHPVIFGK